MCGTVYEQHIDVLECGVASLVEIGVSQPWLAHQRGLVTLCLQLHWSPISYMCNH